MSSGLHVRFVLGSIDCFSKLFFLSQSKPSARAKWFSLTFWNIWTLAGFFTYVSFHLIYVSQNDSVSSRPKLVTVFIDIYNKYCGLILSATLVLTGYVQQTEIARINLLFVEIEETFLRRMRIKIKNLNTMRFVLVQTGLVFAALVCTELSNCLMYIGPTSISIDDHCFLLCIIPALTTAMVECRLFAYFLLMHKRLKIINRTIAFHRNNLSADPDVECHNVDIQLQDMRSKIFFINELIGSRKINEQGKAKSDNARHFIAKLKSMMASSWRFIKNLLNVQKNRIFDDNFDAAHRNSTTRNDYVERVCCMQIIYTKLYEISDLISKAYGIQIIAIISVQFITLTTLLYYFSMNIIRILSSKLPENELLEASADVTSSAMWIGIYMYKLYSICFCIHITADEGLKVGHYLHVFGLHTANLSEKFKIKMFQLQLLQQRIKFQPYGLFDVDLGLFSMITGAVVTYILILIQFDVAQKA